MDKRYFSEKVVEWYKENKRDLPWRKTKDPYKIWLSEVILQQTRVIQGLPYYLRFIEKFPLVSDLASASEQDVLRLWQGLGYYTRARNLHKCANEIVKKYDGVFPNTFETLKKLPGIGDYTAAAIASISYKQPVAVVDGNVFRVLSRVFGIENDINSPEGKKIFTSLANELINPRFPHLHNQAVMEFGALFCTPNNPACDQCVFKQSCFAAKNDLQTELPVKKKPKALRKRYFYYFVIQNGNRLLMKKRQHKDIWHGLFDFYLVERETAVNTDNLIGQDPLLKAFKTKNHSFEISDNYKNILSHQVIISKFVMINNRTESFKKIKFFKYYSFKKIADLPKPVLISKFLKDYQFL